MLVPWARLGYIAWNPLLGIWTMRDDADGMDSCTCGCREARAASARPQKFLPLFMNFAGLLSAFGRTMRLN